MSTEVDHSYFGLSIHFLLIFNFLRKFAD
jgi:hypothetical protein